MNNTKNSWMSRNSKRPEGYQVLLKQRYNHEERAEPVNRKSFNQLVRSEHVHWKNHQRKNNLNQIKQYVQKRMKTDYSDHYQQSKVSRSSLSKGQESLKDSARGNQKEKSQRVGESLRVSRSSSWVQKQPPLNSPSPVQQFQSNCTTQQLPRLQILQKRIVQLLDRRLNACVQHCKTRDTQLQIELEEMTSQLRNLRDENPETIERDILHMDKKIRLFQRLMAENMTESEVIKSFYLAKLTHRGRKQRNKTESYTPARKLSITKFGDKLLRTSVVGYSEAKSTFKAPEQDAYKIFKYQNTFFNADRHKQPLPRSSYGRQFLVNPPTYKESCIPKNNNVLGKTTSDKFLNSSYREDFMAKRAERVNYKQMDAYRNKIKSLAVNYGRREGSLSPNSYNVFMAKLDNSKEKKLQRKQSYLKGRPLLTESRYAYKVAEGATTASQIRHSNLHKLKHHYMKKARG